MSCFSPALIVQFLVSAAILAGIFMIAKFLLGKVQLGEPWPSVLYVLRILVYVVVAIWIIYFLAELWSCAFPSGFPRLGGR